MKILFLSHSFPPTWGGVERQNYHLSEELKKISQIKVIANRKGKAWLPIFLPTAFLKSFFLIPRYDACLLGNGVLAPIGAFLKFVFPQKNFFCVVHGLDITFAHKNGWLSKIYKNINIPSLNKLDKLFMVGNHTIDEAEKIGIKREQCVFIPNGINFGELSATDSRQEMERILGMDLGGKKVILQIGRFVPHKGAEWFIRNVVPKLPENYIFAAVGGIVSGAAAGNENVFPRCEKAVRDLSLENHVKLIGDIGEKDKLILLNSADLYVLPNIKVPGYMEGFGITAIEAGACGRVVVASDLEGLKDAIKNKENGFLVEPGSVAIYVQKINELLADNNFRKAFGEKARRFVIENYSWDKIARKYLEEMEKASLPLEKRGTQE